MSKNNKVVSSTCCLCGEKFEGFGNNADPVKMRGRCCDVCNFMKVIPARIGLMASRPPKKGKTHAI